MMDAMVRRRDLIGKVHRGLVAWTTIAGREDVGELWRLSVDLARRRQAAGELS
jgi:hypothetical protein